MAYAATTYLASDISYGQTTVDYALNDLYEKSESGKVKELSFSDFFKEIFGDDKKTSLPTITII